MMGRAEQRQVKAARNETLMRDVNERIEDVANEAHHPAFLCECGNENCIDTLAMSLGEYEAVRSSPVRFAIKPGHEDLAAERVVAQRDHYAVVEKIGTAAEISARRDPRSSRT